MPSAAVSSVSTDSFTDLSVGCSVRIFSSIYAYRGKEFLRLFEPRFSRAKVASPTVSEVSSETVSAASTAICSDSAMLCSSVFPAFGKDSRKFGLRGFGLYRRRALSGSGCGSYGNSLFFGNCLFLRNSRFFVFVFVLFLGIPVLSGAAQTEFFRNFRVCRVVQYISVVKRYNSCVKSIDKGLLVRSDNNGYSRLIYQD